LAERELFRMGARPFEDLKVLEFTHVAAGPLIGRFLADYGAEVIHVESRSRPDIMRSYPPAKDSISGVNRGLMFAIYNTNKYGLALNLKHPKAVELAKGLVKWSDVVIENFTPGAMARLGLGYDDLEQTKPGLIMLSTCNMGQTGPHADHPGYGSHLTFLSGFGHLTGWPDRPPVLLYGPYVDMISAAFSSCALIAALDHRHRTGQGQYIDVSQYETGLQFMTPALLDYQVNGRLMSREGNRSPYAVPHGAYPCRGEDRWCVIAVWSDEEWDVLRLAIGDPQWARDDKFATLQGRKDNEEELDHCLVEWTRRFTPREIMERLQAVGVEAGVVMTCQEIMEDPSVRNYLWEEVEHPEIGSYQVELAGFKPSKTPHQIQMPGPLLGQHNESVLTQILGLSPSELEQLQGEGVFD
jgi:benzylsuccinate CoA-transferase BbsF subunit